MSKPQTTTQPDPKPAPAETETKAKKVSTGVLAGRLYERLKNLKDEEAEEIRTAPESIKSRYAEKRSKMLAAAPPVVASIALRMIEPADEKAAE
jgi:hypothetical protein